MAQIVSIHLDTEDPTTSPALEVDHVAARSWNGWAVPVTTAQALRDFIAAWAEMDPNGTWRPQGIREAWVNGHGDIVDTMPGDDDVAARPVLIYEDGESDPDVWEAARSRSGAVLADGEWSTLYVLDGWTWIEVVR
ncbi:hypothetical protein GCM10009785_35060 [Brooklawnia cerclae]|uniref:Uncharacterized protein n=1 Tax=Brooklawnia cerclae TaxID=349934 RepID=A0ABX0SNE3_9ACTN|nr:hypothetical protein [Brooklawnia cerclae]NIH58281.1 hypothetical protein [Brooklawnia cerclae]